jgi:cell division protein FtsL
MRYITIITAILYLALPAILWWHEQQETQVLRLLASDIQQLQQENATLRQEIERRTSGEYIMNASFAYITGEGE